ncbi:MAG: hypothetical protein WCH10_03390 [bacterium]
MVRYILALRQSPCNRRCANCGNKFYPQKHVLNQRYCSKKKCQSARKTDWIRHKLKYDKDYKTYRQEIQNKWKSNNPGYWAKYKKDFAEIKPPNEAKTHIIKILIEKNTLNDLSKTKVINCNCQLVLK